MRTGSTLAGIVLAAALARGAPPLALAQAPAPAAPPLVLDCTTFPRALDETALVARFGRANVAAVTLDGAEGETLRGTAVYPKDPTRRLEIVWADDARRRGLSSAVVRGQSTWTVRTPGPARPLVGLRASLDAVEEANERPFLINGFHWDMGGFSAGWKGGTLDHMPGGCSVSVRFNPDPTVKGRGADKVSGEKQFGSSDPGVRAVRPSVSVISLDWPE